MSASDPAGEGGAGGVGTPPDCTAGSDDREVDAGLATVRRARFVLADPELVAAEIVDANGAGFAQILAAELLIRADEVTR